MNKITQETINLIAELKAQGFSSRMIAETLGIGKSTVNDNYNSRILPNGPRKLFIDLETAAAKVYTFGRWKQNIGQDNIAQEGGYILCASYRTDTDGKIRTLAATPKEAIQGDDGRIVEGIYKLYENADVSISHNALGFDHKVIQTRGIANGLGALPKVKVLDTLVMAKRHMRLPSNRLDSIGEYFNLGRKVKHEGIKLWIEVQEGNKEAMKRMQEYCEQDVNLLYNVYCKLQALGHRELNSALYYSDDAVHCPTCGSTDLTATGRSVYTTLSEFAEVKCNECGAIHRTRTNLADRSKLKLQAL